VSGILRKYRAISEAIVQWSRAQRG
jgi:hypothetical protein